jgi:hypothetical protein
MTVPVIGEYQLGRDAAENLPGMLEITQHADPGQCVRTCGRRGGRRVMSQW